MGVYMDNDLYKAIIESYIKAEKILIGIGTDLIQPSKEVIDFFGENLNKKDYFIITSRNDNLFRGSIIKEKRVCNPLLSNNEKQWDLYNAWLSGTLNKKLLIIELGENFSKPQIFRWPFEKIVYINQLSTFYRIHEKYYQLPENIGDRAYGYKINVNAFIDSLIEMMKV